MHGCGRHASLQGVYALGSKRISRLEFWAGPPGLTHTLQARFIHSSSHSCMHSFRQQMSLPSRTVWMPHWVKSAPRSVGGRDGARGCKDLSPSSLHLSASSPFPSQVCSRPRVSRPRYTEFCFSSAQPPLPSQVSSVEQRGRVTLTHTHTYTHTQRFLWKKHVLNPLATRRPHSFMHSFAHSFIHSRSISPAWSGARPRRPGTLGRSEPSGQGGRWECRRSTRRGRASPCLGVGGGGSRSLRGQQPHQHERNVLVSGTQALRQKQLVPRPPWNPAPADANQLDPARTAWAGWPRDGPRQGPSRPAG